MRAFGKCGEQHRHRQQRRDAEPGQYLPSRRLRERIISMQRSPLVAALSGTMQTQAIHLVTRVRQREPPGKYGRSR
jgi:hypothetical protein